jgi:hypothetical protein
MNILTKTHAGKIYYFSGDRNAEEYTQTTEKLSEATKFLTMELDTYKMDRYGFERLEVEL